MGTRRRKGLLLSLGAEGLTLEQGVTEVSSKSGTLYEHPDGNLTKGKAPVQISSRDGATSTGAASSAFLSGYDQIKW